MGYKFRFSGEEDFMGETDDGARCVEHVGEVFPPRCADCDALRRESAPDEWDPLDVPDWMPLAS